MDLIEHAKACKYVATSGVSVIAIGDDLEEIVINARQDHVGGENIAVWELPGKLLGIVTSAGDYVRLRYVDTPATM